MQTRTYFAKDGTALSYRSLGNPDDPAVLLCHGLGAAGRQFDADAAFFADRGYYVLVPDLRGHGASSAPAGYPDAAFSIAVMADDLVALLDHADVRSVHWVGNSLGGILGLQLLPEHAARFASFAMFGTAFALNLPAIAGPSIVWLYRVFGSALLSRLSSWGTTRHALARPLVASMLADFDPLVGRAITSHVRRYDLTAQGLGFAGPMLVLVGERDTAVNEALKPALRHIGKRANLTVSSLSEGGHMANLDATDAWRDALLNFWSRIDPA